LFLHPILAEYLTLDGQAKGSCLIAPFTLRIKFNPIKEGAFMEDIEVYFSSMQKPIVLKIRAEVNYIDRNDSPACPDFRQRPDDCCGDEPTLIHVINAQTGKPIKEARVRIVETEGSNAT